MSLKLIPPLEGKTWQDILKLLGNGNFIKIEFRPPNCQEEVDLGEMQGMTSRSIWWICEATFHEACPREGKQTGWSLVTQRIPFRLYDPVD